MILWTGLTIIVEFISLKSGIIRRVLNGEPTIIIKKGKIQRKVISGKTLVGLKLIETLKTSTLVLVVGNGRIIE